MKIKKILSPFIVGVMSALAVILTLNLDLYTWVLFIGWVSFFLFGKSPKQIFFTFIQIVLGFGIAILMLVNGHFLNSIIGEIGTGLSIILVMTSFMYFVPKLKTVNVIPAYFMGIITFYSTHPKLELTEISVIIGTIVLGFAFAWITENINLNWQEAINTLKKYGS
ncbi:DUF1097 domain-containing protein [Elizabethkingia anophelis]|nr:DUF1097 domain-containing protein [Elizabethkingia anophelis]